MARFLYILLVILLFGVLIAIHEFGHFITAKLLGVKVNEFAIGMGPALWSRQKGETLYALRAFPVGGYCAMEGEDEDTGDPRAFSRQKGWKKVVILCAGSFMNFLLGLVIMVALSLGVSEVSAPVISGFMEGFALEGESGLMVGDRILEIDGHAVWLNNDAFLYLDRNDGVNGVDLVVEREGRRLALDDFPMTRAIEAEENGRIVKKFGITIGRMEELTIPGRIRYGFLQTVDFVRIVWVSLGDLVTGRVSVSELSGVVGVVDVVSEMGTQVQNEAKSAVAGVLGVLSMMALIAVNLAVMNMLPFVVLLALMAVVALHDVWNIFA